MNLPAGYTREALVRCAQREIDQRMRVYPRLVSVGRMSQRKADDELGMMSAILDVLRQLPIEPPAQPGLFRTEPKR